MKKFCIKAVSVAAASVCASTAFAGSITAPTASTKYAVESLVSTTDITLPALTYSMGVGRTTAQDFTVIIKPSNNGTNKFTAASCSNALLAFAVTGAAGAATASLKRADPTECAYEIDVTTAFVANVTNITFGGAAGQNFVLDSHGLATAGTTVSLEVGIWELSENARIDNTTDKTVAVALSGNALSLTAAADSLTKADVNDEQGPLFGFVTEATAPSDADATARAAFVVGNNTGATTWLLPDGATPWDFTTNGTSINVTVAGNFSGMASTNGFLVAAPAGTVTATATPAGATATFSLLPANITAGQTNSTITTSFVSARTASLGTSRTFGVSAVGDVITGADVALSGNSSWWTWGANASQLMTPYFTTNSAFLSRFFFLNTGTGSVNYTATCYSETGNAITYGAAQTGTLSANGQTAVNAASVCTFAGNTRGAVIFTINAPINSVKANYQSVDPVTLNNMVVPMTRPYNNANTTE